MAGAEGLVGRQQGLFDVVLCVRVTDERRFKLCRWKIHAFLREHLMKTSKAFPVAMFGVVPANNGSRMKENRDH